MNLRDKSLLRLAEWDGQLPNGYGSRSNKNTIYKAAQIWELGYKEPIQKLLSMVFHMLERHLYPLANIVIL